MDEWLRSLVPWGTEVLVWIQSYSTPWLEFLAKFFTGLGYGQFYLLFMPAVYWCIDKEIGISLGYLSLLSSWINSAIKYALQIPRPSDPRIRALWPDPSPSFPSGHAQNAVVNWGYLAVRFGKPGFLRALACWVIATIAIVGIGLSRLVLGVHYPQDVLGGWLIGLGVLVVYLRAERPVRRWLGRQPPILQLVLAVAVPSALIFLHPADAEGRYPAEAAISSMSALVGLGIGVLMERAWVRFRVEGYWLQRIVRFLVGVILVAVLYAGPAAFVPSELSHGAEAGVRFARYALLGWAMAFPIPWLFVRLRLAGQVGRRV